MMRLAFFFKQKNIIMRKNIISVFTKKNVTVLMSNSVNVDFFKRGNPCLTAPFSR